MKNHPALTICAIFFTYMTCMLPYCASETPCPATLGIECVENCMLHESEGMCQMKTETDKSLTLYCSAENSQEHSQDHEWTGLHCEIDDKYYLCQVDNSLQYFKYENMGEVHYTSYYGELCSNTCGKHDKNYFWCDTPKGWDYCSHRNGIDYEGYACREDHPCGKYGESYYWCWREVSSWGYCGPVVANTLVANTLLAICPGISEDELHDDNALDQSYSADYWNKLFQTQQIMILGTPLLKQASQHHWLKSKANDEEIFIKTDQRECIQVIFKACQDLKDIADGYSLREEIIELIAKWDNGYLQNEAKSGLIKSKNLRIDLQGVVPRGNEHYHNLQIQINRPREKGESTTVSQILIPEDPKIPATNVRRAFTESFLNRAKVTVEVKRVQQCKNKK